MKKIIPKIYMNNCQEAITYYQKVLGGTIKNTYTEHAFFYGELHINENCIIYFINTPDTVKKAYQTSLFLEFNSKEELIKIYNSLKTDSIVTAELEKTLWGTYMTKLTDKYGNEWELSSEMH